MDASELMLATLHRRPFSDPGWLFELKYDGYRCLIRKTADQVDLLTRNGNLLNGSFPEIVAAVAAIQGDVVLDAELTVDDENGRSSFERLQRRAVTRTPRNMRAAAQADPARLYVFDALSIDGEDVRELALPERKNRLRDAFEDTSRIIYASGVVSAGEWVFEHAVSLGLEGMIAKRLDSAYTKGRSTNWLKVKNSDYGRPAALGWGRK